MGKKHGNVVHSQRKQTQIKYAIKAIELQREYLHHLKEVGYYPHSGQAEILKLLYNPNTHIRKLMAQCSRNFGKSTMLGIWIVWRCGLYARRKAYLIAPYVALVKEIYYDSSFINDIIPPGWLRDGDKGFNKNELRWMFKNGSFLKLDGADNEARVRGYKPTDLGVDEFQDWKKEVWEAMEPNLLAHNATAFIAGTPPEEENQYTEQAELIQELSRRGDNRYYHFHRTIWDNPRFKKEDVEIIKNNLIRRGDQLTWEREYLAKFVKGGKARIYPTFSKERHMFSREQIQKEVYDNWYEHEPYTIFDPSGSRWAAAGFLYNRRKARIYWVFSVVENDPKVLSCGMIWPRVKALEEEWFHDLNEPYRVYDEAAKLFFSEMIALDVVLAPTQKQLNKKSDSISLARDVLARNRIMVLDELGDVEDEFESYRRDKNDRIVKKKDDLMDCFQYFLVECGYTLEEAAIIEKRHDPRTDGMRRGYSYAEDMRASNENNMDVTIDSRLMDIGGVI